MWKVIAAATVLATSVANGQITSYKTNTPAPVKGDSDKVVCKSEETIGTRLGTKKVCMTVAEWNERISAQRERTEHLQSSICTPGEGAGCLDPVDVTRPMP